MPPLVRNAELELTEVPKPRGGTRILTTLGAREARAYAEAVRALAPAVWRHLDAGVHVIGATRAPGDPLGLARTRWRRAVGRALTGSVTVTSDVTACFPSIGPSAAAVGLASSGARLGDIDRLLAVLSAIARAGVEGLPVGPEPSAIVADAVLSIADRAVRGSGGTIVRWVDDVVIAAPDARTAAQAFDAWASALRGLGLEPHEGKTRTFRDPVEAAADILGPHRSEPSLRSRGMMRAP